MSERTSPETEEAIAILNGCGWTDRKIARALGRWAGATSNIRRRLGLKPIASVYSAKIDHDVALRMWSEGANDGEISRVFGSTASGVARWRYRHNLDTNAEFAVIIPPTEKRRARAKLRLGATRSQVSDEVGCCISTITKLRKGMSDPELRRTGLTNRSIRSRVLKDRTIYHRIEKAVGGGLPADVIRDAVDELYLAVLSGNISSKLIPEQAKKFRSKAVQLNMGNFASISWDHSDDGLSLAERYADPTSLM